MLFIIFPWSAIHLHKLVTWVICCFALSILPSICSLCVSISLSSLSSLCVPEKRAWRIWHSGDILRVWWINQLFYFLREKNNPILIISAIENLVIIINLLQCSCECSYYETVSVNWFDQELESLTCLLLATHLLLFMTSIKLYILIQWFTQFKTINYWIDWGG